MALSNSVLPAETHAQLSALLQALQSQDNVARSAAEENLNNDWIVSRPGLLLMGLAEQAQGAEDETTRSFAAVVFRRMATRTRKEGDQEAQELFTSIDSQQRGAIRQKLLECLANEQQAGARNKIGDAIAEVARQGTQTADGAWPEVLQALYNASQSPDAGLRETAFRIFSATPDIIESQHEDMAMGVFQKGFKDEDTNVQLAGVEAFASFFSSLVKAAQKKYFKLINDILQILSPITASKNSDQLTRALLSLIDMAETSPRMFRDQFSDLVKFSIGIVQDKEFDDTARQNALELMATFADNAPAMCKKDPNYVNDMVTQCLSLMTDVGADDDNAEEWNASEDLDLDESDANHVAGEQTMDRLANKLTGQTVLPPTFKWLPQMMISTQWREKHAALMAISAISEGCREMMEAELDQVLGMVLPALQDPHPRVRWAGCNALGQMSTDFAPTMQEKFHATVLPAIIPVLESNESRVQSHAAAALVNFCEEAEKETLEPYLDTLMSRLVNLLQNPRRFVQEQALSTIATVADSAESAFSKYYDTLMPLLFNVLRQVQDKDFRLLRAKAMECATLIALAVGKEKMGNGAHELVQILGSIQENITDSDDPQAGYLLHCWGRMCRVLGQDFIPFLPAVMPPLMELASAKADIQLLDDEEEIARIEGEEGWELVPLKGKVIGINTSTLDDKHTAIELIVIYAQYLEAAFEPYVNEIMEKVALPSLAFFFHDPVRVAAAKAVPQLLNSVKSKYGEASPQLAELWSKTSEKLLEVLTSEPAIDTLAELYQSFYESVEVMGRNCLTAEHMTNFISAAKSVLEDYQKRVENRNAEAAERDGDDEDEDEDTMLAIEDDQTLLSDMNKAFHTVTKHHGTAFLPYWEQLLPFYTAFGQAADPTQRQWALCIFDDVLEFCGSASWSYRQSILPPIAAGIRDDVAANRQAACYGAGVAAAKGGEQWAEFAAESVEPLLQATGRPDAREDDHVYATENACAAIAKVLQCNSSKVPNPQQIVDLWVNTLPVVNDEEAAPFAYSFLALLIDQNNSAVTNKPVFAFESIAKALAAEMLQGQTAERVAQAARKLVAQTGLDAGAAISSMQPEHQAIVQKYFQ